MWNEQVIAAVISAVGGIIVGYITTKYKDVIARKLSGEPRDRMEVIFEGYEKLIKQQQRDIDAKQMSIGNLQIIIDKQKQQLEQSQDLIDSLREELEESKIRNVMLKDQLAGIKKDYRGNGV